MVHRPYWGVVDGGWFIKSPQVLHLLFFLGGTAPQDSTLHATPGFAQPRFPELQRDAPGAQRRGVAERKSNIARRCSGFVQGVATRYDCIDQIRIPQMIVFDVYDSTPDSQEGHRVATLGLVPPG